MKARYNLALDPDAVELLDKLATAQNRSRSNMVEVLITNEFAQAATYLQAGLSEARRILNDQPEPAPIAEEDEEE